MGAKTAVKLRNRGVAYKCQNCGRKLMTADALAAHQRTAHNIISRRRGRFAAAPKPIILDKAFTSKDIVAEIATPPVPTECTQATDNTKMKKSTVEFECPKCFKRFPAYFPTRKHIQKHHCVDRQNIAVSPDHPSLIEPVRIEQCPKCKRKVRAIETHVCDEYDGSKSTGDGRLCVCAACGEWFPNLTAFDFHVVSSHSDHVESMFFPSSLEFVKWKTDMENQTNASYAMLEKYGSKRYYHCNNRDGYKHRSMNNHVCPSTIVVQEFPKGIQVHFYHKHYNHSATDYKLSSKYKKYSITPFLKRAEDYDSLLHLKPDDDDLYMQFKTLMEGIVVDAAKINIATLKIILGKALEITSILSNYDEEELEDPPMSDHQIMTDEQITKALEEPLIKRKMAPTTNTTSNLPDIQITNTTSTTSDLLVETNISKLVEAKRKNTDIETNISDIQEKRPKLEDTFEEDVQAPKIVKAFSLADSIKRCKPVRGKSLAEKVSIETKTELDDEPSSFNDSYKDFVVKNFPSMESIASRTRSKPNIIKTRIGQFKPNAPNTRVDEKTMSKTVPTKVDEKTISKTIPAKVDEKTISKTVPTKVDEKTISKTTPAKVDEKTISKTIPAKVDEKTISKTIPAKVDEKTISKTIPTKVDEIAKPALVTMLKDKSLRNESDKTESTTELLGKTVDDKTKSVSFSAKVVENKTKALPKVDVKVGADLKEYHNTRAKSQIAKIAPKAKMITRVNSRTSFDKPKVDIEYEVKERADDCNILILKI
ncbi:uncharacterized protein LOC123879400 [Maniola jurtina]|uniref:uncharacterized protein LOC123879400 n=1 Tax=Maniola jurtina TaxID=191418 RepID=UPI001E68A67C|nr:uncharacterized protein LOC123879400 [Maniola jurtina]